MNAVYIIHNTAIFYTSAFLYTTGRFSFFLSDGYCVKVDI